MSKNIATYICTGCQIGESIDIEALNSVVINEYNLPLCKQHPFLCNTAGVNLIKSDIENSELDGIVIAACSPRIKTKEFSFDSDLLVERVNLREQVVWCQEPNNEDTQMMAEDYLRMGITKAEKTLNPKPYIPDDLSSDILVIGGGISGITSACEGAKAGYKVILIEKEEKLGGFANKLYKQIPQKAPWKELEEPIIKEKIIELEQLSNIKVLKSSEIKEISGEPGKFEVILMNSGIEEQYKVASIVLATGWKPYDASKLTEFGYGKYKNVITNIEFEKLAKEGNIIRPSDKKKIENILFIQCAGSRDEKHLPYCSNYCCSAS